MRSARPAPRSVLEFGPLTIAYDHTVIAPRPWTIAQSEWAAEAAADAPAGPILELCSGAGHIGLAAAVLAGRPIVQVDANPAACALAAANASTAGWPAEVRCRWLAGAVDPAERFPIIIADPPYVPRALVGGFDDPTLAIDGGVDGMALLIECCGLAAAHLVPGGLLSLQVRGGAQWVKLQPRVPAELVPAGVREFGADRAVVHLTRR